MCDLTLITPEAAQVIKQVRDECPSLRVIGNTDAHSAINKRETLALLSDGIEITQGEWKMKATAGKWMAIDPDMSREMLSGAWRERQWRFPSIARPADNAGGCQEGGVYLVGSMEGVFQLQESGKPYILQVR